MGIAFDSTPVSIETVIRVLEATAAHPNVGVEDLARFAGTGKSTTIRALAALQTLALVGRDGGGRYACRVDGVRRGMDDASARQFIRRALIGYRPFEALCEGLALGEDLRTAVRKASVLLGFSLNEAKKFDLLVRWGQELGVLERDGAVTKLALAPAFDPKNQSSIISDDDIESEAKARLYVAARLERPAYNSLDESERRLLAEALLKYRSDPKESVEKTGQAMENYLRHLCDAKGLGSEAKKLNGAGQLANLLMSKNVIHGHHQKLVDSVGTLRNAKAHHKDKKTLAPWDITDTAAFGSLLLCIVTIRSIADYIATGKQTL